MKKCDPVSLVCQEKNTPLMKIFTPDLLQNPIRTLLEETLNKADTDFSVPAACVFFYDPLAASITGMRFWIPSVAWVRSFRISVRPRRTSPRPCKEF